MSYIKSVAGLPTFSMVPAVSIIDPLLSYPHRHVLSILALHADRYGKAEPTQERIASLAGWFTKDKQGNSVPNKSYVSSLINNENHVKPSDRCGPGLVQLGYVKPGHKQKGFNQPNSYHLTTPLFCNGHIQRSDGTTTKARFTAPTQRDDDNAYKARKAVEMAEFEQQAVQRKKFRAEDQLPLNLGETYCFEGEDYTRDDCDTDLASWQDGFMRAVPDAVYRHFRVVVPAQRDDAF